MSLIDRLYISKPVYNKAVPLPDRTAAYYISYVHEECQSARIIIQLSNSVPMHSRSAAPSQALSSITSEIHCWAACGPAPHAELKVKDSSVVVPAAALTHTLAPPCSVFCRVSATTITTSYTTLPPSAGCCRARGTETSASGPALGAQAGALA